MSNLREIRNKTFILMNKVNGIYILRIDGVYLIHKYDFIKIQQMCSYKQYK